VERQEMARERRRDDEEYAAKVFFAPTAPPVTVSTTHTPNSQYTNNSKQQSHFFIYSDMGHSVPVRDRSPPRAVPSRTSHTTTTAQVVPAVQLASAAPVPLLAEMHYTHDQSAGQRTPPPAVRRAMEALKKAQLVSSMVGTSLQQHH